MVLMNAVQSLLLLKGYLKLHIIELEIHAGLLLDG